MKEDVVFMPRFAIVWLVVLPLFALAGSGCVGEEVVVPAEAPPPARRVILVEAAPVLAVEARPVVRPAPVPREVVTTETPQPAPPPAQTRALETWASRHPEAAKSLGAWAHENPEAARSLFEFDGGRPERAHALVEWALKERSADIDAFTGMHPDWQWFDSHASKNHLGLDRFLEWTRQNPAAAEELAAHPRGLRWVGDHLYASEWRQ